MIASGQKSNQKGEYFSSIENILKPCEWEEGINTFQISTFLSPMKQIFYSEGYYFILGGERLYYSSNRINWLSTNVKNAIDSCIDNKGTIYLLAQNKIVKGKVNIIPYFETISSTNSYYSLATNGDIVIAGGDKEIYYLENDTFQKSLSGLTNSRSSFKVWYKGNRFFATDGTLSTSRPLLMSLDGKNWTEAYPGQVCNSYTKVEYFNNAWYVTLDDSYLYKSADCKNWEKTSINNVCEIIGGQNNFFILNENGRILNLYNQGVASVESGNYIAVQMFNKDQFWSVGTIDGNSTSVAFSEDDGKTWKNFISPVNGSLIKMDGQYFIFDYSNNHKIYFSTDLKNWRESQFAVSLSNITTGQNSAIGVYNYEIYYTSDGITWAKSSQPPFSNSNEKYYMNLSYVQGTFFICTSYNNSYNWYYSTDAGGSWNKANTSNYPSLVNTDLTDMSAVILREYDNVVFAFDAKFTKFKYQYLDLTLKNDWNGVALSCNSKAYANMKNGFCAWGKTDGGISIERNPTRIYLENFSMLYGSDYSFIQLFYVNQRLYAVNSNYNLIYFNDDLTRWQEASIDLYSQSVGFMSYGNGLYILGTSSTIYTSTNGINFYIDNFLTENDFFYVFYTGEFWIGINYESFQYSKDGEQWIKFHEGLGRKILAPKNLTSKDKSFTLLYIGPQLYYYTIPVQIN